MRKGVTLMTILVSPTDSDLAKILGEDALVSSLPERRGADVLIYSQHGVYGAQRKAVPHDFISSFHDGRMVRETTLLPEYTNYCEIICEGEFRYHADGSLVTNYKVPRKYSRTQIEAMKLSIRFVKGVEIVYTENTVRTADYIKIVESYLSKEKHMGLFTRPKVKGLWPIPTQDELWSWVLQGFPEVGPGLAEKMLESFGKIPLVWDCTLEEMMMVPRIGKRAEKIWSILPGSGRKL